MGRASRPKPARLARKLRQIRLSFGVSQDDMVERLGLGDQLSRVVISAFERGAREPALPILLRYARIAGVSVESLIDDEEDLPKAMKAAALQFKELKPGRKPKEKSKR